MSNKSVMEMINEDKYINTEKFPVKPKMPEVLNKRAIDLNMDEIKYLHNTREIYETELGQYQLSLAAYKHAENARILEFRNDLENEHNTKDHKKAQRLWELAWQHGHAELEDVATWYEELSSLLD